MTSSSTQRTGRRYRKSGTGIRSGKLPIPATRLQRVQRKLGKRIKALRKDRGLTPEQLAKQCGVTVVKLLKIEDGQVNVALSTMVHLSRRLGTGLPQLFEGIR